MNKLRNLIMGIVAGFAGLALAQPASAEVTVGGFMTQTVGFGDYKGGSESEDSLHFDTDAEILFTATAQTDGGLTVTAQVELEGHSDTDDDSIDQIDENWLSVEGSFGKVTLGGEDAAVITHGGAGIAGGYGTMGYYDDTDSFTPVGAVIGPVGYRDAQGIRFSTPKVGGFSAAVSYQPEAKDGPRSTSTANNHQVVSAAANFGMSFGSSSITIAGGVLSYGNDAYTAGGLEGDGVELDTTNISGFARDFGDEVAFDFTLNNTPPIHEAGNEVGLGVEWSIGANALYLRHDIRNDYFGRGNDRKSWGVAYERSIGDLSIGIGYATQTTENAIVSKGQFSGVRNTSDDPWTVDFNEQPTLSDAKTSAVVAGAKYGLGSGVSVGASIAWGEVQKQRYIGTVAGDGTSIDITSSSSKTIDGTALAAHIAFSF